MDAMVGDPQSPVNPDPEPSPTSLQAELDVLGASDGAVIVQAEPERRMKLRQHVTSDADAARAAESVSCARA